VGLYEDLKAAKAGDRIELVIEEQADVFYWTVPTTESEAALEATNIVHALIAGTPTNETFKGLDIQWDTDVQYELIGEDDDGYGARFYVSGTFGSNYKPPMFVGPLYGAGMGGAASALLGLLAVGVLGFGAAAVIKQVNVSKMTPAEQLALAEADPSLAKAAVEFKGVVLAALGLVLLRQVQKMRGAAAGE